MKRLIAMVVAAVISCVLLSPSSQAARWDPMHPPIPVDRQPNLDRPSGDDGGWADPGMNVGPAPLVVIVDWIFPVRSFRRTRRAKRNQVWPIRNFD